MDITTIALCIIGVYIFYKICKWVARISAGEAIDDGVLPPCFIVFDIETTGLNPDYNEIIEIGAIRIKTNRSEHEGYQALIKPDNPVPKNITKLTKITNDMVQAEGKSLSEALEGFIDFIDDHPLIAYNSSFDISFINAALIKNNKPRIKNTAYCALKLAREAFPGLDNYKLGTVAEALGIKKDKLHRAMQDCIVTSKIYMSAKHALHKEWQDSL